MIRNRDDLFENQYNRVILLSWYSAIITANLVFLWKGVMYSYHFQEWENRLTWTNLSLRKNHNINHPKYLHGPKRTSLSTHLSVALSSFFNFHCVYYHMAYYIHVHFSYILSVNPNRIHKSVFPMLFSPQNL